MFGKLLIAHRGAMACRILRTLRTLHINSVSVYAESDISSLHVRQADETHSLGDGPAASTYLVIEKILNVARQTGATAIHPGNGFLSDNAAFAEACEAADITFIGPTPAQLRLFGSTQTAKALARTHQIPLLEKTDTLTSTQTAIDAATQIGYPVMLKHTTCNGSIAIHICNTPEEVITAFNTAGSAQYNASNTRNIFLEKYIPYARHLGVQMFGDGNGNIITLGVRDCSVKHRNQTMMTETPPPHLPDHIEQALCAAAVTLGKAVNYRSAGTVEFIYDSQAARFYFAGVKTHLQMEHNVTEQVWQVDLVRWMIKLAAGELPPFSELMHYLMPVGHAIAAPLSAEDPGHSFNPSTGLLTYVSLPKIESKTLRVDAWVDAGCDISPYFNTMMGSICSWSSTREASRILLDKAFARCLVYGVESNRDYVRQILTDKPFIEGQQWIRYLDDVRYKAVTCKVIIAGAHTSVQDYPGRQGYLAIGIPASGPMDDLALRLGNRLLNNEENTAALEITHHGPTLTFNTDTIIAITGAPISALLNDVAIALQTTHFVAAGSTLSLGKIIDGGARSYLCIKGGIQVPDYLGSKSTFTSGQIGGHAGRALRAGDVLHLQPLHVPYTHAHLPPDLYPPLLPIRALRVLVGSIDTPTCANVDAFLATEWAVHSNANRKQIHLTSPHQVYTQNNIYTSALHSNSASGTIGIHGAIDLGGMTPAILGPDTHGRHGVYPVHVIEADLWQLGQLKSGDKVRFIPVDLATARHLVTTINAHIQTLSSRLSTWHPTTCQSPMVHVITANNISLVVRLSGDTYLQLETDASTHTLVPRIRLHALMYAIEQQAIDGILAIAPNSHALLIQYQPEQIALQRLLDLIGNMWGQITSQQDLHVPSRIVHLPLSWNDPACQQAVNEYIKKVRKDAPWCPSNLEYIRCMNGLDDIESVERIVFDASYLVLGLNNTHSAVPMLAPLDPRHCLITTPYTPHRTWTQAHTVGLCGRYIHISCTDGPGNDQLIGQTLQIWNRYQHINAFNGKPWLLNIFDQIRFYPVNADTLADIRKDFLQGRYTLQIEDATLSLADYEAFLLKEADSIAAFQSRQQIAFDAEQQRTNNTDPHTPHEDEQHDSDSMQWYG
jgi:urea carboxylase